MIEQKKKNGRLITLCWLVYVSTYLTKYSYNANINRIMPFFNVNHAEAGLVSTLFFFSFHDGLYRFVLGFGRLVDFLSRFYEPRLV